jgi:hypothetical protein
MKIVQFGVNICADESALSAKISMKQYFSPVQTKDTRGPAQDEVQTFFHVALPYSHTSGYKLL